ncbi:MAG: PQQ-dependent sugar dehydrogenase, partial [Bacteroidota bacterium]
MRNLLTTALCCLTIALWAQTPSPIEVDLQSFATGFNNPVGIYNAGDDRLFIIEQNQGDIEMVDGTGTNIGTFLDVSSKISTGSERGLLGLAFHPDYQNNGRFFVNYTNTQGSTVIEEYTVSGDPNVADFNSGTIIIT